MTRNSALACANLLQSTDLLWEAGVRRYRDLAAQS